MADLSLAIFMFPMLFVLVFSGIPVALSLIATAFLFGVIEFGMVLPTQFHSRLFDVTSNFVLAAIPLFVFMGAMLERAGIAVTERVPLKVGENPHNAHYLATKAAKSGHLL